MGENFAANVFNFIVGGFAIMSTLGSIFLYYRSQLPEHQMKKLDELLEETNEIFRRANAAGLLSMKFRSEFETRLRYLEQEIAKLREDTYQATTFSDEWIAYFKGLSGKIVRMIYRVRALRSCLITAREKTKRRREATLREASSSQTLTTPAPHCFTAGNNDVPIQPGSCPPALDNFTVALREISHEPDGRFARLRDDEAPDVKEDSDVLSPSPTLFSESLPSDTSSRPSSSRWMGRSSRDDTNVKTTSPDIGQLPV